MKYRIASILMVVCIFISCISFAGTTQINADTYYFQAYGILLTDKSLDIKLQGRHVYDEIKITSCKLQKYNGSSWDDFCNLPSPTYIAVNCDIYEVNVVYSSYIGTGKYRIKIVSRLEDDYYGTYNKTIYSTSMTY